MGYKKIFSEVLHMISNSYNMIQIIREADTLTSSLFTITYYFPKILNADLVKSE